MNPVVALLLVGLVIFALFLLSRPNTELHKKEFQKQLLGLFAPGQKLTVPEVNRILEERTGRRKSIRDASTYGALDVLVGEGKLVKEIIRVPIPGGALNKTLYSLPESE